MTAMAKVLGIGDDELLIEREFDAPRGLVFRLWQSREHMLRWWGPEEFTTLELDWELSPGRPWRGSMVSKQYGLSRFSGVVREVEADRRIVFTFRWDDGSRQDPDVAPGDTVVTVTFADRGGRTVQTFHQAPFSDVADRDSHMGGWNSLFNRQRLYVENLAVAEQKGYKA